MYFLCLAHASDEPISHAYGEYSYIYLFNMIFVNYIKIQYKSVPLFFPLAYFSHASEVNYNQILINSRAKSHIFGCNCFARHKISFSFYLDINNNNN